MKLWRAVISCAVILGALGVLSLITPSESAYPNSINNNNSPWNPYPGHSPTMPPPKPTPTPNKNSEHNIYLKYFYGYVNLIPCYDISCEGSGSVLDGPSENGDVYGCQAACDDGDTLDDWNCSDGVGDVPATDPNPNAGYCYGGFGKGSGSCCTFP